jgi:transcriptional regulator with XRE-family HTH domain
MTIKLRANKQLRTERAKYGSQKEFVELINIYEPSLTLQAYSKYELGQRKISVKLAKIIAENLNCFMADLFYNPDFDQSVMKEPLETVKERRDNDFK